MKYIYKKNYFYISFAWIEDHANYNNNTYHLISTVKTVHLVCLNFQLSKFN